MELSDVVSICAAIIAVLSAYAAYKQNEKINRINLKSAYFDEIYKEHLIYKIPEARRYIQFVNGTLIGTCKMTDELKNIQKDSLYYYYNDKKFFLELKKNLQELENYLMQREGQLFDVDEQLEVMNKIQENIEQIYACINEFRLSK